MSRTRLIKPRFFTNEVLAEISPLGRLLFISLWTVADREGRLEHRPKRIKIDCLPYDECNIEGLLSELQRLGFLTIYEVNNNEYIQILNFKKHQKPHAKEQASEIPGLEQATTKVVASNDLGDDLQRLNPSPLTLNPSPLTLNPSPLTLNPSPLTTSPEKAGADHETNLGLPTPHVSQQPGQPDATPSPDTIVMFEELFAIWPAKKKKPQARQSYTIARNRGVAHETMTAGARRFAKYHAEQKTKEQFLQSLDDWINSDGWTSTNGKSANKKPQV